MNVTTEHRERMLRKHTATIGMRVRRSGTCYELHYGNSAVLGGTLDAAESYVKEAYVRRSPGPQPWVQPPPAWAQMIDDYLTTLTAAGQSAPTLKHRRAQLVQMARWLGGSPADVTGENLVSWLGQHPEWAPETRRGNRSAARLFFLWAYKTRRIPTHIADDLPKIKQPKAFARPAPETVWCQALAAADRRQTLILRLAGESGLRRAEIAQVHVGDLTETIDGASLLVHGKGNKLRRVPVATRWLS